MLIEFYIFTVFMCILLEIITRIRFQRNKKIKEAGQRLKRMTPETSILSKIIFIILVTLVPVINMFTISFYYFAILCREDTMVDLVEKLIDLKKKKVFCEECRELVEYEIKEKVMRAGRGWLDFEFNSKYCICKKCGQKVFVPEIRDMDLKEIIRIAELKHKEQMNKNG